MRSAVIRYALLAIPAFLQLLLFSCTPQGCLETTDVFAKCAFYQTGTGKALAPDSVTVYGSGMENSKLYNRQIKPAFIKLPLNPSSDSCIFVMKINQVYDTVTLYYKNLPMLISKECGYVFFHNLDSVKNRKEILDYILVNRYITTSDEESVRIFF